MAITGKQTVGQLGVTLIVQDVAAAADFYRDVLGAEEVQRNFSPHPKHPPEREPVSAELNLAGAQLIVAKENPRVVIGRAALYDPRWAWHAAEVLGAETAYAPKMRASHPALRPQVFPNRQKATT